MVCTFLGHRDASAEIRERLQVEIEKLICDGVTEYLVGNQENFDRMALGVLRNMRVRYPEIRYHVVLAYLPQNDAGEYELGETLFPEGLELVHPRFAIVHRNRWMIQTSDIVVAYVTHDWGGAAKAVSMAERKGKKIVRL